MSPFEELGRDVANALEDEVGDAQRMRQRQVLIESAEAGTQRRAPWLWPTLAAASVAGAVAFVIVGQPDSTETETVAEQVVETGDGIHAGMFLAAPADEVLRIEVQQGGELELSPGARGRVAEVSAQGVGLVLEGGEMAASVLPAQPTNWRVQAGPLSVDAQSAVFQVEWDPERYVFRLVVREGEVRVRGGELGEEGVVVEAGQSVEADRDHATVHAADGQVAVRDVPPVADEVEAEDAGDDEGEVVAMQKNKRRGEPKPNWLALADDGDYRAALKQAEAAGFSTLLRGLGPEELKKLADTARLARDAKRAREALFALRERFPNRREGKMSAFLLGRISVDLDRDHAAAAKWFRTYVQENPRGRFAQEARGRVIDALKRSGDAAGAREAAKDYLGEHPQGAYAGLARSVLGG
jgi:hypothetical protein